MKVDPLMLMYVALELGKLRGSNDAVLQFVEARKAEGKDDAEVLEAMRAERIRLQDEVSAKLG